MSTSHPEPSRERTCRDLINFLDDYVADRQSPELRVAFESHLSECRHCRDYVRTYRNTIVLAQDAMGDESPETSLPDDLVHAIIESVRRTS